jgi:nucleotide-binding universal stress UspA family protein
MTHVNEGVHPVVAGVDGSDSALHAVRWAAREAARRHAPLLLVHVCHLAPVRHPRQVAPPPAYQAAILGEGRHWLAEAAEAATRVVPDLSVVTDLREGHAADTLIAESRTAQLVVVGSRGHGGFTALLTGSVAVALSAHGHCPVAVVRTSGVDGVPAAAGPVVVGVDGSALSDAAVTFAFEAAAAIDVPLVAVHTWEDTHMTGAWTALPGTVDWDWLQQGEEKQLAARLAAWREKFPQVEVVAVVERERPARALLAHAAGARLLVVGSRGRGALAGLGLGSVSQSVLHHAECPVVVARTERT